MWCHIEPSFSVLQGAPALHCTVLSQVPPINRSEKFQFFYHLTTLCYHPCFLFLITHKKDVQLCFFSTLHFLMIAFFSFTCCSFIYIYIHIRYIHEYICTYMLFIRIYSYSYICKRRNAILILILNDNIITSISFHN